MGLRSMSMKCYYSKYQFIISFILACVVLCVLFCMYVLFCIHGNDIRDIMDINCRGVAGWITCMWISCIFFNFCVLRYQQYFELLVGFC